MSDLDALRQRGIQSRALVDGTGTAKNGTTKLTGLCDRGMRPICQVDATGTENGGSVTLAQLRSIGIETFCSVDETGVETGGLTVAQLAARGVRGMCAVDATGVALNGTATLNQLRARGIVPFCPLDENGTAATLGAPKPVNTVAPVESGTETSGSTLSVTDGTWLHTPTSYTYQWMQALTSGGVVVTSGGEPDGVAISGATSATYVLQSGDVGQFIFCAVTATNAAGSATKASNVSGAIAAGYQGAGDIVSGASFFVGLRAYNAAAIGGNAIKLVRASDSALQDIVTLANGSIDAASAATFLTATNGHTSTVYDQTGNGVDFTVGPFGSAAIYAQSTLNGKPVMRFDGSGAVNTLQHTGAVSISSPYTVSFVARRTANFSGQEAIFGYSNTATMVFKGSNTFEVFDGGDIPSIPGPTDNVFSTMAVVVNGASSKVYINGSLVASGTLNSITLTNPILIGVDLFSEVLDGELVELGVWPGALTGTQITNLNSNQTTYWGPF